MSLGWAPVSCLLQEASSRRNASSPKYSDIHNLYIVLGKPWANFWEASWGWGWRTNPFPRLWLKPVPINTKQLLIHKVLPALRKHYCNPKLRSLWSKWLDSTRGFLSLLPSSTLVTATLAETGLGCRRSHVPTSPNHLCQLLGDGAGVRW